MIRAVCVSLVLLSAVPSRAEAPSAQTSTEPLPAGAVTRLGDARLMLAGEASVLVFSPDGSMLAVVSERGIDDDIHVFDIRTGLERIKLPSTVRGSPIGMLLAFSHDSKRLWSGDVVWDTASWIQLPMRFPGRTLALSPDDKYVALHGQLPGELILWDSQKAVQVSAATISSDDKQADNQPAANNPGNNAAANQAANQLAMRNIEAESKKYISCVRFSADGKTLTVSDFGGDLQIREVPSLKLVKEVQSRDESDVRATAFSPDLRRRAVGSQPDLNILDVASGKVLCTCHGKDRNAWFHLLCFSPDGKSLVSSTRNRDGLFIWDAVSGELRERINYDQFVDIEGLAFSRDGRFLAIGGRSRDSCFRVLDWTTKQDLFPASRPHGPVTDLAYSPNSRQIAVATTDGQIALYETATGKSSLTLHEDGNRSVVYSPDGWVLAAVGQRGGYHLWSTDTGDDLAQRSTSTHHGIDDRLRSFAISPLLDNLAQGMEDGHVRILRTATGAERRMVQAYTDGAVAAIAWSPDEKILATARGGSMMVRPQPGNEQSEHESVQLWDPTTGKPRKKLVSTIVPDAELYVGGRSGFSRIRFSPDGVYLAAVYSTGTIIIWHVSTGRQICEIQRNIAAPFSFSADGQMLLYAEDRAVHAVEIASMQFCFERVLPSPPVAAGSRSPFGAFGGSDVTAIAAAPDGKTFATSLVRDETTLIWSLAPDGGGSESLAAPASDAEMERLWNSLAQIDAKPAYVAIWRLALAGDRAAAFIRGRFPPTNDVVRDEPKMNRMIADLDSDIPAVREQATDDLTTLGAVAEPLLRKTLEKKPSLEQRTRIEHLLEALDSPVQRTGGEPLRRIRAVRALERIDTPLAAKLLEELAAGSASARETRDARQALDRRKRFAKGR